jgi:GWxTD domain-containing protein
MSVRPKLALAWPFHVGAGGRPPTSSTRTTRSGWTKSSHSCCLTRKTFRDLKDKAERVEFQKISGRGAIPPRHVEIQATYNADRAEADKQFKVGGLLGSATDCGRVYLLLGKPDEMKVDKQSGDAPSLRPPEVWTYRDRPGQTFAGGQVQIAFEKDCQLPQGARLSDQLNKVAESKIVHPNLAYKKGPDGKLVKLADQLPKPSPAQALLKTPRQDFPVTTQNAMMLRSPEGATYVAGLVRAAGVPREAGAKMQPVNVVVQAVDAQGRTSAQKDRLVNGEFADDGSVMASYGMTLRPGKYTLNVAVLAANSGKGWWPPSPSRSRTERR